MFNRSYRKSLLVWLYHCQRPETETTSHTRRSFTVEKNYRGRGHFAHIVLRWYNRYTGESSQCGEYQTYTYCSCGVVWTIRSRIAMSNRDGSYPCIRTPLANYRHERRWWEYHNYDGPVSNIARAKPHKCPRKWTFQFCYYCYFFITFFFTTLTTE